MDVIKAAQNNLWPVHLTTDPETIKNNYNKMADVYDHGSVSAGWNATFEQILSELLPLLPKKDGENNSNEKFRVFDAGCGSGLLLEQRDFTQYEIDLYGVDLSDKLLALAERKNMYKYLKVADLSKEMEFEDEYFDVILSNGVLGYIQNDTTFDEYLRILKPGGHILFTMRQAHYDERGWKEAVEDTDSNCELYRKIQFQSYPNNPDYHHPYVFVAVQKNN